MSIPDHVGVYGVGRMGAGIAHAFLVAGAAVTVVESDEHAVVAARERVRSSVARADERGTLEEDVASVLDRLVVTSRPGWPRPRTSTPR